jgi:hypothetical protein
MIHILDLTVDPFIIKRKIQVAVTSLEKHENDEYDWTLAVSAEFNKELNFVKKIVYPRLVTSKKSKKKTVTITTQPFSISRVSFICGF